MLLNYMTSLSEQGQPWTSGALCSTQGQPWTSGPLCCTQGQPTALQPEFAGLATPGADPFLGPPASQLPPRVLGDWRSTGNPNFNGLRPQSRCVQHFKLPAQGADWKPQLQWPAAPVQVRPAFQIARSGGNISAVPKSCHAALTWR